MKRILAAVGIAMILTGVGAVTIPAFAGNGNPHHEQQDGCDHGNTGKPCKPDPQPSHGKDCETHGNHGGINEDHCSGTTNTHTSSSSTTYSTNPTNSTSPTTSTTTTTQSTTTSTKPTGSTTKSETTQSITNTTTTRSNPAINSVGRTVPTATVLPATQPKELAFTGFNYTLLAIALGLILTGTILTALTHTKIVRKN
jgi:hypothetical protein